MFRRFALPVIALVAVAAVGCVPPPAETVKPAPPRPPITLPAPKPAPPRPPITVPTTTTTTTAPPRSAAELAWSAAREACLSEAVAAIPELAETFGADVRTLVAAEFENPRPDFEASDELAALHNDFHVEFVTTLAGVLDKMDAWGDLAGDERTTEQVEALEDAAALFGTRVLSSSLIDSARNMVDGAAHVEDPQRFLDSLDVDIERMVTETAAAHAAMRASCEASPV